MRGILSPVRMLAIASVLLPVAAAAAPCDGLLEEVPSGGGASRPVSTMDLARLRDIGYNTLFPGESLLGVSPDGNSVTFGMYRGDPDTNRYCHAVMAMDIQPGSRPHILDQSDELTLQAVPIRGLRVEYGLPASVLPVWSPDGNWIAYLKRSGGKTQAWRVPAAGGAPQQVSHSPIDVDHIAWTADGTALLAASRPALLEAKAALDREGLRGHLYDHRFAPYASSSPSLPLPVPYAVDAIDLASGATRAATDAERARVPLPPENPDPDQNMRDAIASDGSRAWTGRERPDDYLSPVSIHAQRPGAATSRCADPACTAPRSSAFLFTAWSEDGRDLLFVRREGWANAGFSLYRWSPETGAIRRLVSGGDPLLACERAGARLLCAREGSLQPRRLVLIDAQTGARDAAVRSQSRVRFAAAGQCRAHHLEE